MQTIHTIRRAYPEDAATIATIKSACWPTEPASVPAIARVLAEPDHVTLIAEVDGRAAGFVDGFVTLAAGSVRRWEIDLLAVHPDSRRRGLGRALTDACTTAGRAFDPSFARALIQMSNAVSQIAFARCGYAQSTPCRLVVAGERIHHTASEPHDAYLIPVMTLGYRGLWIEGKRTKAAFLEANAIRTRMAWETAGAAIPLDRPDELEAASNAGYVVVGDYAWWIMPYSD